MKFISDPAFKDLIERTGKSQTIESNVPVDGLEDFDFYDAIFPGEGDAEEEVEEDGRRGRSPSRGGGVTNSIKRQHAHSTGPASGKGIRSLSTTDSKSNTGTENTEFESEKGVQRYRSSSLGMRYSRRSLSSRKSSGIANGSNPIGSPIGTSRKASPRVIKKNATGAKNSNKLKSGDKFGIGKSEDEDEDDIWARVYHETPPEVSKLIRTAKGHVYGVWLADVHPLSLHSDQQCNQLHFVKEGNHYASNSTSSTAAAVSAVAPAVPAYSGDASGVPAPGTDAPPSNASVNSKKFDWQMDLLREYDDKRFLKFESYLIAQRQSAYNVSLCPATAGSNCYTHLGTVNCSIKLCI